MMAARSHEGQQACRTGQPGQSVAHLAGDAAAWTGRFFLLVAVLGAPWFLGAVEAWAQFWLLTTVTIAMACVAIYLLLRPAKRGILSLSPAILPLLLGIGLGLFHLIPLDERTLERVSPQAATLARELLPATDSAEPLGLASLELKPVSNRRPTTVYPAATRHSLALLILGTSVFFLAAVLFSRPTTHLWLLGLITINGAAIAFFGLAQNLTWSGQIYWTIVLTNGGAPFGPFVNRNNGGGYLILCLAAAIGLTLWGLGHYFNAWDSTAISCRRSQQSMASRVKARILSAVAELNAGILTWLTLAGLLVAAICCSLSRGSVLAMLSAVLVTAGCMVAYRRRGFAVLWPIAAIAIGLFLITWVDLSDEVGSRLATLFDDEIVHEERLFHWQDGLQAATDYWRSGSGLGTYRFVYASYQDRLSEHWFHYAENVYLQILVEAGIAGLLLFLTGLAFVVAAIRRLLLCSSDLTTLAFAVTGIFALTGQAVASFFDFGLFLPANFMLFALLCGALTGTAARFRNTPSRIAASWKPTLYRTVALLIALGLLAGCLWGRSELRSLVPVEGAMRATRLAGNLRDLSSEQLAVHIQQLTNAGCFHPDDAELHRRLAELWIQRYQVETTKELLAKTAFSPDDPRLAQLASPMLVHQRAWLFERANSPDQLEALRHSPVVQENLLPALKHLVASRRACPLLPEVHCALAQLCGLVGSVSMDETHIQRTRQLAPGNPDLLYICGLLEFQASRFSSAYASWKASLSLSPRYLTPVLQIAAGSLADEGVLASLLPDDPDLLVRLAKQRFVDEGSDLIRERLVARAEILLTKSELPKAERLFLQGSIQSLRGSFTEAIASYEQALLLRSYEVEWRYELARLLQKQGFLEEAHEQARRCARLEPREKKHKELLDEIFASQIAKPSTTHGS